MAHAALAVDKEQVRMLVMSVGCTEAAKQTGIPLNTVLSWSARGKWLKPQSTQLPPTVQPRAINAINPADALQNVLNERKEKSKLNLSQFVVEASEEALRTPAGSKLKVAQDVRHVAAIHSTLYPEKETPGLVLNLGVIAGGMQ